MKRLYVMIVVMITVLLICSVLTNAQTKVAATGNPDMQTDSIALRQLIINLLKWHQSDRGEDFVPKLNHPDDSIYTGIDWEAHNKRMRQLDNTGFFTEAFLANYQDIAVYLDKECKRSKEKYYVGDLPPYDHANEWCNCEDYPTNVWKQIRLVNVKINGNSAAFTWSWATSFSYSIKTQKENGTWRIDYLEKFTVKNFSW